MADVLPFNDPIIRETDKDTNTVTFHQEAVHQAYRSTKEGHPVFENVDFITIRGTGQDKQEVDREVKEEDKRLYPKQWANYKAGLEQVPEGTSLKEWPEIDKATLMRCQSLNIFTVEQLRELSDAGLQNFGPGGVALQKKARHWLNESKPSSRTAARLAIAEDFEDRAHALIGNVLWKEQDCGVASDLVKRIRGHIPDLDDELELEVRRHDEKVAMIESRKQRLGLYIEKLGEQIANYQAGEEVKNKAARGMPAVKSTASAEAAPAAPSATQAPDLQAIIAKAVADGIAQATAGLSAQMATLVEENVDLKAGKRKPAA